MRNFKLLGLIIPLMVLLSCEKESESLKADFTFDPSTGNTGTIFNFDASSSKNAAQYRWDWNNDGVWDENYSTSATVSRQFGESGSLIVKLEVLGADGGVKSVTKPITVALGPAPIISKTFYIQAKINANKWETAQKDVPGYSSDGEGMATMLTPYTVAIDFGSDITDSKILALQGQTLSFGGSGVNASILKSVGGVYIGTGYASNQNGSEFKVISVTNGGNFQGHTSYIVEGTFNCKMDNDANSSPMELTEGKFAIRLFDDN